MAWARADLPAAGLLAAGLPLAEPAEPEAEGLAAADPDPDPVTVGAPL